MTHPDTQTYRDAWLAQADARAGNTIDLPAEERDRIADRFIDVGFRAAVDVGYHAAENAATNPQPPAGEALRVLVVVDNRKQRMYAVTCDQEQAREWAREITAKYGGDNLSATMYAGLVYPGRRNP